MFKFIPVTFPFFLLVLYSGCVTVQKAKSAADAFERKQYFIAASLYEKEFESNSDESYKSKLAYGAAMSFKNINETNQAVRWFSEAARLDFGDIAWRELGLSQIQQGQYDAAIQTFETIMNKKGNSEEFRLLLSTARQAKLQAQENLNIYIVSPLALNTPASEYSPSVDYNGHLVFTSDRPSLTTPDVYKWTGRNYSDLYIGKPENGEVSSFSADINTTGNEGPATFNQAGNVVLFTRCGLTTNAVDGYCKIYMSVYDGGKWSAGTPLAFQKESINYIHPCFAVHDSVVFFASDDSKGEGGFDIYYSEWKDGNWAGPERLGRRINSSNNEKFPFMYADTLYYASDRLGGLGGLDIYKSFVNTAGEWQPPINLKAPINSNEDDFGLIIDPNSSGEQLKGYFSSSRTGGLGKDDIYSFVRTQTDESVLVYNAPKKDTVVAIKKAIKYQLFLSIKVVQAVHENPEDPNSKVILRKPLSNALVLVKEGETPIQLRTNPNGNAVQEIKYDENYFVLANFPGLLNASKSISTTNYRDENNPLRTINVEILLDKAYTGKEVIISDIFYDLDKWFIRADAEPSLNQLTQLLKDNPKIKIQLSSHTDCQGKDDYNLDLSNKRAKSAIDYLALHGVSADRLKSKGFGETQLVKKCVCETCTEEEHQANRRTTFTILE
ncbi:MAG: OmpA family protein [Saprospiraceae bacterium]